MISFHKKNDDPASELVAFFDFLAALFRGLRHND